MLFWLIIGFGSIALAGILNQYLEDKKKHESKMKEIERKLKAESYRKTRK